MSLLSRFSIPRSQSARTAAAVEAWRSTPTEQRLQTFQARCEVEKPSAIDLFLLGCALLRGGDAAGAARAFGPAHHADWRLESAALLTFACIKASAESRPMETISGHVQTTWEEMGRPVLPRHRKERQIFEGLCDRPLTESTSPEELLHRILG